MLVIVLARDKARDVPLDQVDHLLLTRQQMALYDSVTRFIVGTARMRDRASRGWPRARNLREGAWSQGQESEDRNKERYAKMTGDDDKS